MITIELDKEDSDKIEKILNGRELTSDYSGLTMEEAIYIEQIIWGMNCSEGRSYAEESVKEKRKHKKQD